MIDGHWAPGAGTTCTYLPAAGLYYVGARERRLVNHDDELGSTAFEIGLGVSKLVQGARAVGAWVDHAPGREPKAGDIAFLSNGPPLTEHVEVVLDPAVWKAATAGRPTRAATRPRVVTREIDDRREDGGARLLSAPSPLPVAGSWRKLVGGWTVDRVAFDAPPSGPAVAPPSSSAAAVVAGVVITGGALALLYAALHGPPRQDA